MKALTDFINESIIYENIDVDIATDINDCFGFKYPFHALLFERHMKTGSLNDEKLETSDEMAYGNIRYMNTSKLLSIRKENADLLKSIPVYNPGRYKNVYTYLSGFDPNLMGIASLMVLSKDSSDFESNLNKFTKPGRSIKIQEVKPIYKYQDMLAYRVFSNDDYLFTVLFKA